MKLNSIFRHNEARRMMQRLWIGCIALLTACADDALDAPPATPDSTGDAITLDLSLEITDMRGQDATRALGDAPSATPSIVLLVFDESHFLSGAYRATQCDETASREVYLLKNDDGSTTETETLGDGESGERTTVTCYRYTVTLRTTDEKRYIHILVNHDLDLSQLQYGTEGSIFSSDLMTAGGERDVYWGRVTLVNGITEDNMTEVVDALKHVQLVRNYSKITIEANALASASDGSYTLTDIQWGLAYIPTVSFVAPYISNNVFADYIEEAYQNGVVGSIKTAGYKALTNTQGYSGHVPLNDRNADSFYRVTEDTLLSDVIADDDKIEWHEVTQPIYTYENQGSSGSSLWHKTCIFIRGHLDGNTDLYTYYRVSLVDPDNNYASLNILRGIEYNIKMTRVTDEGFASVKDAYIRPASNNLSGSTVNQSYPIVTDGKAALRVQYIKRYVLSPEPFAMTYRYVPDCSDVASDGTYIADNGAVALFDADRESAWLVSANDESTVSYSGDADDGASCFKTITIDAHNTYLSDGTQSATGNYGLVTFTPSAIPSGAVATISHVRVATTNVTADGTVIPSSLYRDIEIILRRRYQVDGVEVMRDDRYPLLDRTGTQTAAAGSADCYTLSVDIPNDMAQELFPLTFTLETTPEIIYPNVQKSIMEVNGVDQSVFDATDTKSFHYHRAVAYSAYTNKLPAHGFGGFKQDDTHAKITFFFKLNTPRLQEIMGAANSATVTFGLYCPTFSPDPESDLQQLLPMTLVVDCVFTPDDAGDTYSVHIREHTHTDSYGQTVTFTEYYADSSTKTYYYRNSAGALEKFDESDALK